MSLDDEGYVFVRKMTMEKVKIPKGHVKCPRCKGSGEVRVYYGQPWDRGQFATCHVCGGKGYAEKEFVEKVMKNEV